ncbi:MAG: very short patch repair endonuclease [Catonella sp.]|uniref:very short patch repair endonuclease n=1 Tax=Catonella sp. TaxID=2382125 RepID=UPI003F9EE6D1
MDNLTKEQRKRNMQHIKSKNTSIELKLCKALYKSGFHYYKNYGKLPGKPDIVLPKDKIAIFCDSEFFHGKDWEILKNRLESGVRSEYWIKKIDRNRKRDIEVNKQLSFMGWLVIRFWGKEINKNVDECVRAVKEAIWDRKTYYLDNL